MCWVGFVGVYMIHTGDGSRRLRWEITAEWPFLLMRRRRSAGSAALNSLLFPTLSRRPFQSRGWTAVQSHYCTIRPLFTSPSRSPLTAAFVPEPIKTTNLLRLCLSVSPWKAAAGYWWWTAGKCRPEAGRCGVPGGVFVWGSSWGGGFTLLAPADKRSFHRLRGRDKRISALNSHEWKEEEPTNTAGFKGDFIGGTGGTVHPSSSQKSLSVFLCMWRKEVWIRFTQRICFFKGRNCM